MNQPYGHDYRPAPGESNQFLALQLSIARRADELLRQKRRATDLELWLEAEREVLATRALGPPAGSD